MPERRSPTRSPRSPTSSIGIVTVAVIELELNGATVLFTGRAGGVSEAPYETLNLGPGTADDPALVRENVRRAAGGLPVARLRQVHGVSVHTAASADAEAELREGDGLVTTGRDLALAALTADCLPVAIATPAAIGIVHAGWRGLANGVIEAGVKALRALDASGSIAAVIGPGAGACCYQVNADVAGLFPDDATASGTVDLKSAARRRLLAAGAETARDVGRCTICEPELFFSHRRSGPVTGRQAGLIWR